MRSGSCGDQDAPEISGLAAIAGSLERDVRLEHGPGIIEHPLAGELVKAGSPCIHERQSTPPGVAIGRPPNVRIGRGMRNFHGLCG